MWVDRVSGFVRRRRVEDEARDQARHRLLVAATASMACRDEAGRFRELASVAGAIKARGGKHGVEQVIVVPDCFGATKRLAVVLVEDESSADELHIVVPLSDRRFIGCKLRCDGDVECFNGAAY